jgi:hypothetical protein
MRLHSPREGSKGKELENARIGLLSLSHFVASLNSKAGSFSSPHVVGFANPIVLGKGELDVEPLKGLDGIPSGTLQNPSTGRIFGQSTVLRLTADGNGYRDR